MDTPPVRRPDPTIAVLAALATYRATLLVTDDTITEPAREAVKAALTGHAVVIEDGRVACRCGRTFGTMPSPRDAGIPNAAVGAEMHVHAARQQTGGLRGKALTLIGCPWCVSVYVGAAAAGTGLRWGHRRWWQWGALTLAASGATGLLHRAAHP